MIRNYNSLSSGTSATLKRTWQKKAAMLLFFVMFCVMGVQGQISVTVTNGTNTTPNLASSYSSLSSALTDLNAVTAMSGPVTLTCTSGTSETAPVKGFVLGSATLNAALSATNTITINKSDVGAVIINAGVGTAAGPSATPDGMLYLNGADYVTIDGLTFTDGNTTNAAVTMEYGIAFFKTNSLMNNAYGNYIIYNAIGSKMMEKQFRNLGNTQIDLTAYPKGLYFINLTVAGKVYQAKIIKK
jgi:hypothetical protein